MQRLEKLIFHSEKVIQVKLLFSSSSWRPSLWSLGKSTQPGLLSSKINFNTGSNGGTGQEIHLNRLIDVPNSLFKIKDVQMQKIRHSIFQFIFSKSYASL